MKYYAVGDIHGCLKQMKGAIEFFRNNSEKGDKIVFLGDYIDRGPDSVGCLNMVRDNIDDHDFVFLKGNHEYMLTDKNSRIMYGELSLTVKQIEKRGENLDTYIDLVSRLKEKFFVDGMYFVHAGINPHLALNEQTEEEHLWVREPYLQYRKPFEDNIVVISGHTPVKETGFYHGNKILLDGGCVFGNKLSIGVIEDKELLEIVKI